MSMFYNTNDNGDNNSSSSSDNYPDSGGSWSYPPSSSYNNYYNNYYMPPWAYSDAQPPSDPPTGPYQPRAYDWVNFVLSVPALVLVCGFGTVANVVNLIVFYRQGILADSCTLSLASLAVSDFCLCLLSFFGGVFLFPHDFRFLTDKHFFIEFGAWTWGELSWNVMKPNPLFVKTTSWITVYLALERMVSVTFPFHVKLIFTPYRSCGVMVVILAAAIIIDVPSYLPTEFLEAPNTPARQRIAELQQLSTYLNQYVLRLCSIAIIFVLNFIIIVKVVVAKKFRDRSQTKMKTTTTTTKKGGNSNSNNPASDRSTSQNAEVKESGKTNKDIGETSGSASVSSSGNKAVKVDKEFKLVVMVTLLSVMFLLCYVINGFAAMILELNLMDVEAFASLSLDVLKVVQYAGDLGEGINSSCNIFVYYTMSSRYKKELRGMWKCLGRRRRGGEL